jgi:hypothetical protein
MAISQLNKAKEFICFPKINFILAISIEIIWREKDNFLLSVKKKFKVNF